jgi:indolepyruvate ferredoxin oxidoreductase
MDTRQALKNLGIDEDAANSLGIALFKVTVSWPLEPTSIRDFCQSLDTVLVVEEKRPVIETQVKDILYHVPADQRPNVIGKTDLTEKPLLPTTYELNADQIGSIIAACLQPLDGFESFQETFQKTLQKKPTSHKDHLQRLPYYCSGCPHNTSTPQLPQGSRALAGIGCHYMATWITPTTTKTFSQMGGEGVPWVGQAPFTTEKHVFANIGDGTYYHSGILAIRASVAAKVNITYKILYNDAVAMTGGQPVDGPLSVWKISHQVYAEGVRRIALVSDDLSCYPLGISFAHGTTLHSRDELAEVQESLKAWPGTSVLIYDQTCAAEKRRRRKRGLAEDPDKRIFINETVCEGCGDCSKKSNCLSVIPLETEWGRKRTIDQSSCNKDYSCIKGFCPSFVSVIGGKLRKPQIALLPETLFARLPEPPNLSLDHPYSIYVTGIGGTGVITIGALIGMAAHLEGKGCTVVDMAGLAQKGGSVVSHIRLSKAPEDILATRIGTGEANLLLGADIVVSASSEGLSKIDKERTHVIINTHQTITGHFTQDSNYTFPDQEMRTSLIRATGQDRLEFIAATTLATALMGDSITANLFLVGYALQKGYIPITVEALIEAIHLNGVTVDMNVLAFNWGRLAAVDLKIVGDFARKEMPLDPDHQLSKTLEEKIRRRHVFLVDYQDQAYADRYLMLVQKVADREEKIGMTGLTEAVAQTYFRLLAIKDEYEVARLYTNGEFMHRLKQQFEGDYKLAFHLAPPLFARRDPRTGHLKKATYGQWMLKVFKYLAKLKFLRGTIFDIFSYSAERRLEQHLILDFETTLAKVMALLTPKNHAVACQIVTLPQSIRGFGHVKLRNLEAARKEEAKLWAMM